MGRKSISQKNLELAKALFEERRVLFCRKYPEYKEEDILTVDDLIPLEEEKRKEIKLLELARAKERSDAKQAQCKDLIAVQWDAHALYMNYVSVPKIHSLTGIPMHELQRLIYEEGGWKKQRDETKKEIKEAVKHAALMGLREVTGLGIGIIKESFLSFKEQLEAQGRKATIYEADTISKIFQKLHRAKLLEEETEDPSYKQKSLSPQELLAALGKDPYLRAAIIDARAVEDAEFEHVDENESDKHEDSLATPN